MIRNKLFPETINFQIISKKKVKKYWIEIP